VEAVNKSVYISAGASLSEMKIIREEPSGLVTVLIDGRIVYFKLDLLVSSLAGKLLLQEYDRRYKTMHLVAEVIYSHFREESTPEFSVEDPIGSWEGEVWVNGCNPPVRVMETTLTRTWAGRVLKHGDKLSPWDMLRYLWQDCISLN
jgi:hypothetical protein